jgi:hypothetical protein
MNRWLPFALVLATAQAACSSSASPVPSTDAGPRGDAELDPTGDADGDGLCNGREAEFSTDPLRPDSDGDGFPDYYELVLSYDPLLPSSPERSRAHRLLEDPEDTITVDVSASVRASGEDFQGAFAAGEVPRDGSGATAALFHRGSTAFASDPDDNVASIDTEGQLFRGVVGTTTLLFEVRFAFGDAEPANCIRPLPFRYNIKRSDGREVSSQRFILLLVPPGGALGRTGFCPPPERCL